MSSSTGSCDKSSIPAATEFKMSGIHCVAKIWALFHDTDIEMSQITPMDPDLMFSQIRENVPHGNNLREVFACIQASGAGQDLENVGEFG
ncbi:MAG: hypothetical protein J6S69_10590 [Proteobacteria bacterium]|nr:hypothetical protein [Pseudomonadota bacterium]